MTIMEIMTIVMFNPHADLSKVGNGWPMPIRGPVMRAGPRISGLLAWFVLVSLLIGLYLPVCPPPDIGGWVCQVPFA